MPGTAATVYRLEEEPIEMCQHKTAYVIPLALSTASVAETNHTAVQNHSIQSPLFSMHLDAESRNA